jgi:hypothetical protein
MTRYIIIDRNSGYVFFDENASAPIEAVQQAEAKIGEGGRQYEATWQSDINAAWDVYSAPAEFAEVEQGDAEVVEAGCTYEATLKAA